LMQTPARSIPQPCSCNSACEMSARGSRSSRLHARNGAADGQPESDYSLHEIGCPGPRTADGNAPFAMPAGSNSPMT
jgi:hypothetical protein